jgi:ribose/xylose/arabinose/galactoside ABC-type transport system permease subunit
LTTVLPTAEARRPLLQRVNRADALFALAILILIVFAGFTSDAFLTQRNVVNVSRQIVTNGFLSLGMLIVMRTGGIDLSVGSVVSFAGLLATGLQAQMVFPLAICVALVMGTVVGWAPRGRGGLLLASRLGIAQPNVGVG